MAPDVRLQPSDLRPQTLASCAWAFSAHPFALAVLPPMRSQVVLLESNIRDRGLRLRSEVSWSRVARLASCRAAVESEVFRDRLHGFDAEADVLVEVDAEVFRSVDDVVAVHLAGEGFVFHPL